ncbi:hypothetical protein TWF481_000565 [Arthrobotrys musiformis]|uniref:F-box domain-containing protein n=1 Tax=Arthrobotrys musiformis TaxID=47236 RepID=A0AAV9WN41_9PEZI
MQTATSNGGVSLTSLSTELIHEIFFYFGRTRGAARLARVCRLLNALISPMLYRNLIIEIESGKGVNNRYIRSLLLVGGPGESARQDANLKYVRTFGVVGKVDTRAPPSTRSVVHPNTASFLQLILNRLSKDTLTSFIWDTDIVLNSEIQNTLIKNQTKITSLAIYQHPDPILSEPIPALIILGMKSLTSIHIGGIQSIPQLAATIRAVRRNSATLVHFGLSLCRHMREIVNKSTGVIGFYVVEADKDAEITSFKTFPAIKSIHIDGIANWDNFVSKARLDGLELEAWKKVEQLNVELLGSNSNLFRKLQSYKVQPNSLTVGLDDEYLPELRSYIENSIGLVEVCIRVKGPFDEDLPLD